LTEKHFIHDRGVPVSPQKKRNARRKKTEREAGDAIAAGGAETEEEALTIKDLPEFCLAYCSSQAGR
jgi:hypothetical protein